MGALESPRLEQEKIENQKRNGPTWPRSSIGEFKPRLSNHIGESSGRPPERSGVIESRRRSQTFFPRLNLNESRAKPDELVQAFSAICDRWHLAPSDRALILGLQDDLEIADLIYKGSLMPLTRDMRDRITYIIGISLGIGDLIDDEPKLEKEWISSQFEALGGVSPLELFRNGGFAELLKVFAFVQHLKNVE